MQKRHDKKKTTAPHTLENFNGRSPETLTAYEEGGAAFFYSVYRRKKYCYLNSFSPLAQKTVKVFINFGVRKQLYQ